MGFLLKLNDHLADNLWLLATILGISLVFTIGLFIAALFHTCKGTKNPFTIGMCICVLVDCMLYAMYLYNYFV